MIFNNFFLPNIGIDLTLVGLNSLIMNKKLLIGLGILAGSATVYAIYHYFFRNPSTGNSNATPQVPTGTSFTGSYIQIGKTGSNYFHIADPRPVAGTLNVGDNVSIIGDVPFVGTFPIAKTWIDQNNNLGAILIANSKFPESNQKEGTQLHTYDGKYKIVKA